MDQLLTDEQWNKLCRCANAYRSKWLMLYKTVEDQIEGCEMELHQLRNYLDTLGIKMRVVNYVSCKKQSPTWEDVRARKTRKSKKGYSERLRSIYSRY